MAAFGFLPQNFGMEWGPMNDTLSFYECRLSVEDDTGDDTRTLPAVFIFL